MELTKLITVDVYRDGGSYGASFETDDGRIYGVWLQRSKLPDDSGLHHRWLFTYFGEARPENSLPIITGSQDERDLTGKLSGFLAASEAEFATGAGAVAGNRLRRLRELIYYIERRETCFSSDLARWRSA